MLIRPFQLDIIPNVTVETSGLGNVVQSSSEPPDYTIVRQITSSYLPPSQLPVGRMLYAPYPEMVGLVAIAAVQNNTTSTQTINIRINTTREDGTTIITNSDCSLSHLWILNNDITANSTTGANVYASRGYTMICPVGGYLRIKLWCPNAALPITQLTIISFPVVRNLDFNRCVIWGQFLQSTHVSGSTLVSIFPCTYLRSGSSSYAQHNNSEVRALPCYLYDYPLYTLAIAGTLTFPFGLQVHTANTTTQPTFGTYRTSIVGYIAHVPTLPL